MSRARVPGVIELDIEAEDGMRGLPGREELERLVAVALASAGLDDGHVAVHFVGEERMAELNRRHRGRPGPTDVLSFPIDAAGPAAGPRELGDVVICPPRAANLAETVVHGALHLAGMDHETDHGEMLGLQAEIMRWEGAAG